MINPWQKRSEEIIAGKYGKELKSVMFLNIITEKEEEFILFSQKDWSIILPVTEDKRVVVVTQFKQGCNKIIHELPAGTADFQKETPKEVAKRELLEETGYEAREVIFLGPSLWMSSRNSETRFFPFLGIDCRKIQEARYDASEEIETELIPLEDWIAMTLREIEEPSSVIATYRALPHLGWNITR